MVGRFKVKTGCRTCKNRKVKCDEGRPACRRCVSAGRTCDGYGIWGGDGNSHDHRQRPLPSRQNKFALWRPPWVSILGDIAEEKLCLEWFTCRTAKKIPGPFALTLWEILLFQASLNEPAVLHALLTLSSIHQSGVFNGTSQINNTPDEHEQFMLQHYTKAIRYLRPHFSTKDRASIRVALITCVVFIWLEFLRGHFNSAQAHLKNGLKVLRELQVYGNADNGILLRPCRDPIDDWIIEAFSRLHLQVELFEQTHHYPCLVLKASGPEPAITQFQSIDQAWRQLERLLNRLIHLTERARKQQALLKSTINYPLVSLVGHQQRIQAELDQWLDTFEASRKDLQGPEVEVLAWLLYSYHAMANIMVAACLRPDDESIFDSQTDQFIFLTQQCAIIRKMRSSEPHVLAPLWHGMNMSRSIVDMGWIPPLYYTALKCRVHRARLHAIRLLESASHREGIWDSMITARIARRVMEIEERDLYRDVDMADDFPLSSCPEPRDLSLPILPDSERIREVKVVLPDGPTDSISLFYRRKHSTDLELVRLCI